MMIRETIPYTTEEAWLEARRLDLTSTDISALFGVSPYMTAFELWHRKNSPDGFEFEPGENERTRWGQRLQTSIAHGVAEDKGWSVMPLRDYMRIPELRLGSSFDYRVLGAGPGDEKSPSEDAILECKNVDSLEFRNSWGETDFGLEAPPHIEMQLQHQLLVSGLKEGYIAALIGGNRIELLHRFYDETIGNRILEEAAKFWAMTEPPAPDFHKDADFIRRLYRAADAEKEIIANDRVAELMAEHVDLGAIAKAAQDNQDAKRAEILTLIGDASKVHAPGFRLNCEERAGYEVKAHMRKGFRNFRIYETKV